MDDTRPRLAAERAADPLRHDLLYLQAEIQRLYGIKNMPVEEVHKLHAELERRQIGLDPGVNELSRELQLRQHFRAYRRLYDYSMERGVLTDPKLLDSDLAKLLIPWRALGNNAFNLHWLGFMSSIKMLGTPAQRAKWVPLCRQTAIIGCYAQTELGHGSDVMNLETTATFDRAKQAFILHTPTLTATKFWPGCLGHMANFALVVAQLIVNGKRHGVQTFIAQIRDLATHKPMPGVELGDIGDKIALSQSDNGWLRFTHCAIPRDQMLMRFAEVASDGTYTPPDKKEAKLVYASMLTLRMQFLIFSAGFTSNAATVAVRYSVQRTQFRRQKGSREERKILDYLAQQCKLAPIVASVWAFFFCYDHVSQAYYKFFEEVNALHSGKNTSFGKGAFKRLPDLHSSASALKAWISDLTLEHINTALHSCGGHGFLEQSGFAFMFRATSAYSTMEGDNTVLYQQTARYLLKCDQNNQKIRENSDVMYLKDKEALLEPLAKPLPLLSDKNVLRVFQRRVVWQLERVTVQIAGHLGDGGDMLKVWNEHAQQELVELAKYHAMAIVVQEWVKGCERMSRGPPRVKAVFELLKDQFVTWLMKRESGSLLRSGGVSAEQMEEVDHRWLETTKALRRNLVTLVDAFMTRDGMLMSTIGHSEGGVYQRIMEHVKGKNPTARVQSYEGFEAAIRPLLRAKL